MWNGVGHNDLRQVLARVYLVDRICAEDSVSDDRDRHFRTVRLHNVGRLH